MKPIFNIRNLRNQYILFIVTVILTIVVTQVIIQYDLNNQNEDAHLINIAGRQRMLSQRISKLVLYIRLDNRDEQTLKARLDTLDNLIRHWEKVHNSLRNGSSEFGLTNRRSPRIDSMLAQISDPMTRIVSACKQLVAQPDSTAILNAAEVVSENELRFLHQMEMTVAAYQQEAEAKLGDLKKVEIALAAASIIILLMEFVYIFIPMVRGLKNTNRELAEVNKELGATNEELHATEEELRSNLDFMSALKEEAAAREQHFREVLENATDMIYELDEKGKFSYVNPLMENICGYSKDELRDKHYWDLIHPDHRSEVVEFYERQRKEKKETSYFEFPIVTRWGSNRWIGQNVRMSFRASWVHKVSVVARDITALTTARHALEANEELFRSLTENAPVGIYQLDIDGKVTFINKRWFDIVGLDHGVERDARFAAIHPDDRDKVMAAWGHAIKTHSELSIEFRYQTAKKGTTWVVNDLHPVRNKDNQVAGFIGTMSDITTKKEAEQVLRQAKEKAEEATLAKSQFLSMMSHEIRTPMNAIIGLTNLLLQEKPRDDQQESLKLLKFSGENLLTIINDVLDFSKIEAGKMELEQVPFNLYDSLKNIHHMLEQRADDKGIRLRFQYDATLPKVFIGDPVRIAQIVTNLVGNAIKFTEHGHVELAVTRGNTSAGMHSLRFSVTDTGIGIAPEKAKVIFDSFSQASSDTTRKFGGTGLGLSITKRLLGLMGSDIELKSTPGKGSEFFFFLSLIEGRLSEESAHQKPDPATDFVKNKVRVLLVEDNRVNQIVASNFLRKWGIEVDFANHGKEALELIRNKSYQLVLMDLQMPEMDGYEATRQIRSMDHDPYFREVPIIALTASAMIDIKAKVIETGMTDFISKPFLPEELQAKISKYVLTPPVAKAGGPRTINLDLYTEGDVDFKHELARLLIRNIEELQQALQQALDRGEADIFRKANHKVKTTIAMLGDHEFMALTEEIKDTVVQNPVLTSALQHRITIFKRSCERLIKGLEEEIES